MGAIAAALVNAGMKQAQALIIEQGIGASGTKPTQPQLQESLVRVGVDHHTATMLSTTLLSGVPGDGISPVFSAVRAALDAGQSTAIGVVGDSTGDAVTEWPYLLGQLLAAQYPAHTVQHLAWNTTDQSFSGAPSVIQTGPDGDRYAAMDGSSTSFVEPDSAVNSITGDLELYCDFSLTDWTPSTEQTLIAKFGNAGQYAFWFFINQANGGRPTLRWSTDGTAQISADCPSGQGWVAPADGDRLKLRVRLDVNNGGGGYTVTFETATVYGSWTVVGTVTTAAGTTSVFDSTATLTLGARGQTGGAASFMNGRIYGAEVRNGIGGELVAPALPELWSRRSTTTLMYGSPVLTIVSGSHAGQGSVYLGESTRIKKLTPNYGQALTIVSTSHNEGIYVGNEFLGFLDTLFSGIVGRLPYSALAITAQNIKKAPAANVREHNQRCGRSIPIYAAAKNYGLVNAYRVVSADDVNADGTHPDPAGSSAWAAEVFRLIQSA